MSHATATTTTAPVTVVCSSALFLITAVTMAPTLIGLPVTLDQCDVVLPTVLILRNRRGIVGLTTVMQQQPQSHMPSQTYANYTMDPPKVSFLFQSSVSPPICLYMLMYIMVYAFCFQVPIWMPYSLTSGGSIIEACTSAALWSIPMTGICASWWWSLVTPGMHWVAAPQLFQVGGTLWYSSHPPPYPNNMVGKQALGLGRESPELPTFPSWLEGVVFSNFGSIQ